MTEPVLPADDVAERLLLKIVMADGYFQYSPGVVDTRPDFTDEEIAYLKRLIDGDEGRG